MRYTGTKSSHLEDYMHTSQNEHSLLFSISTKICSLFIWENILISYVSILLKFWIYKEIFENSDEIHRRNKSEQLHGMARQPKPWWNSFCNKDLMGTQSSATERGDQSRGVYSLEGCAVSCVTQYHNWQYTAKINFKIGIWKMRSLRGFDLITCRHLCNTSGFNRYIYTILTSAASSSVTHIVVWKWLFAEMSCKWSLCDNFWVTELCLFSRVCPGCPAPVSSSMHPGLATGVKRHEERPSHLRPGLTAIRTGSEHNT